MKELQGGVTAAKGFTAASAAAGIKYQGRTDMAMIFSQSPCTTAGTFTKNIVKAAPVIWDRGIVKSGAKAHAVIVNSGIANAGTGREGMEICEKTAAFVSSVCNVPADSVLIGSTGVIGMQIPIDRIEEGIRLMVPALSGSLEAGTAASKAIMTTDTVNKEFAYEIELPAAEGEGTVKAVVGGMSKGSGMIHPNMCTMLGYITTDAAIDKTLLQKALSAIVEDTFNMISVDGDTSTNDTLLVLANGEAKNREITAEDESYRVFYEALYTLCRVLAVKMASDGEGASKLIESQVIHMDTVENAKILAKSVITSSLVKAMVFGRDANCGRLLCALGYAGPEFDPDAVEIRMLAEDGREILFCSGGQVLPFDEELALQIMSEEKVTFISDMKMGEAAATAWGCDLTYDYVSINADYRS
ncbi:MAG: bifunctional glutamate N-acetyltransferase/amino-acid acetyltransferase ArgJ [Lachnospiraceae bacterium]|nr:bifunctional glutamate N-acetyltransferase/amino-acid acetyltransferase ArgJ [Lachnospiraceae bacterium]